jgi:hypothetical protein
LKARRHRLAILHKLGNDHLHHFADVVDGLFPSVAPSGCTLSLKLGAIRAPAILVGFNDDIDWKLITDLPVQSREAAIEKLRWYALRWKIEVFHKILKSGCRAEEARLRTAERLVKLLISVFCILSWRVFWMTMINRSVPDAEPGLALTKVETKLLDQLVPDKDNRSPRPKTLSIYLTKVARLGGYLTRASDPPPGNTVMWRGISRLADIKLGAMLAAPACG